MISLTRRAYAKVNLTLGVSRPLPAGSQHRGRDVSGYHLLSSWMAPIDLWDTVTIEPAPRTGVQVRWAADAPSTSPIDWPPERDLALRAVLAVERLARHALAVRVRIDKRIPVGGGLGGGSSDAAAVVLGLIELLHLRVAARDLLALGHSLGSDVPFFLDDAGRDFPPRPALVGGLGDRLTRVSRTTGRLVLIVPPFGCPTAGVYRAFDGLVAGGAPHRGAGAARAKAAILAGRAGLRPSLLYNDLGEAACAAEPRLRALAAAVAPLAPVHVTGSGSCLFIVSDDPEQDSQRVRRAIDGAGLAAAVLPTRLV